MNKTGKDETRKHTIGVISDTHGFLRPEVFKVFDGVDHILHAGDLDTLRIIDELRQIAPVTFVRGNMDHGAWAMRVPESVRLNLAGWQIELQHIPDESSGGKTSGHKIVIHGHTHTPREEWVDQTLFLNPGSAGPRRNHNIPTVARLYLTEKHAEVEFIEVL